MGAHGAPAAGRLLPGGRLGGLLPTAAQLARLPPAAARLPRRSVSYPGPQQGSLSVGSDTQQQVVAVLWTWRQLGEYSLTWTRMACGRDE